MKIELRTKIPVTEDEMREIESIETKSIYPKNLQLVDRLPRKRGRRSIYNTDGTFEEYVQENFNV